MAYTMHYCPTCATRRPALGYTCSVCGGPVRLTNRYTRVAFDRLAPAWGAHTDATQEPQRTAA
jgi:hypothetical protein